MEKVIKTYVEKCYKGIIVSDISIELVEDREPMFIKNDGKMEGFRFYDVECVIDGDKCYEGEATNYSNWYYIGKRYSLEEIKKIVGNDPNYRILVANMENNNIEYVCRTQVGSFLPMDENDMTWMEYTNKYGREKIARKMFDNLREHIGEKITYKAWWYGTDFNGTEVLRNVNDFGSIETEGHGIPFVGYGSAIQSIELAETGEKLYLNPYIEDHYNLRTDDEIEVIERKIYGDPITDEKKAQRIKEEEEREKAIEESNKRAKSQKQSLMEAGKALVKPGTEEEWEKFVDKNSNDGYSVFVVKATVSMMKKFEEGVPFDEAEDQVYDEEYGLTGFLAGATAHALSFFAKQGEEYRIYWNSKYDVGPEEKGTVNPAILNIRKK